MKNMIEIEGAKVIFPTSFGYFDPHVSDWPRSTPTFMFLHCGGLWNKGKHPDNVHSYFGYIDECQYLSGIVAGNMTKSKKLGFVAAKPIPQVRRNINAFLLGARSVNPKAEVHVIFTGDWSSRSRKPRPPTSCSSKGCDVFTCHVDSPQVVVENGREGRQVHLRLPRQPGGRRRRQGT